jgi:hypothetical protein
VTINAPYRVTISGLTITGGLACGGCANFGVGNGGGIYNGGTLIHDTITFNRASLGGEIHNASGRFTVRKDTITNNSPDNCDADPLANSLPV